MADMMVKLAKLDIVTAHPPILPLPATTSSAMSQHSPAFSPSIPNPIHQLPPPRMPKLEIPLFIGDNVVDWLFQINQIFTFHQTPIDHKLIIAGFYMTGLALQWYQWMHTTLQFHLWDDFTRKIELHFGPSSFINHEAQLYKLKQQTTVAAYLHEFECLSNQISGLITSNLLNCFLSGLHDDIQIELYLLKPQSLHDAMGIARLVEDKCNVTRLNHFTRRPSVPRPLPIPSSPPISPICPAQLPIK